VVLVEVLVSSSCEVRSSSSRSFEGDLVGFSSRSWHEDTAQSLLHFLLRRSCGDPSEMLSAAFA